MSSIKRGASCNCVHLLLVVCFIAPFALLASLGLPPPFELAVAARQCAARTSEVKNNNAVRDANFAFVEPMRGGAAGQPTVESANFVLANLCLDLLAAKNNDKNSQQVRICVATSKK